MLYEVIVINKNTNIISEFRGIYEKLEHANLYSKLHGYEVADDEEMKVVEKKLNTLENVPATAVLKFQTFDKSPKYRDVIQGKERSWFLEKVEMHVQSIKYPSQGRLEIDDNAKRLKEGEAVLYKDDEYDDTSFTFCFPYPTSLLLETSCTKATLVKLAEKAFKAMQRKISKKNSVYLDKSFDFRKYI